MVDIAASRKVNFEQKIQDWLLQSWIHNEPDPIFREALTAVIHSVWPEAHPNGDANNRLSYLPLPGLCSQALSRSTDTATAVNVAWVLLYMASYLLDKIEDQETVLPVFNLFDPGVVANLTTGLIFHAQRILAELEPSPETPLTTLNAIRRKYNQVALEVCAGQHRDLTVKEPTFNQIWDIVDAKSGKFFALGAYLGARLGTDDPATLESFSQYGRRLGLLIQIANDIHGIGKEQDTGSDLASGKRTLPVLFALWVLPEDQRARLVQLLNSAPTDPKAEIEARKIIISAGAIVYLSLEARKHRQKAMDGLALLRLAPDATHPLYDLLDFASHIRRVQTRPIDSAVD